MTIEQDIKWLSNHKQFANFAETIFSIRESYISAMHDATGERIQQISGRILAYDDMLKMIDSTELIRKHSHQ